MNRHIAESIILENEMAENWSYKKNVKTQSCSPECKKTLNYFNLPKNSTTIALGLFHMYVSLFGTSGYVVCMYNCTST